MRDKQFIDDDNLFEDFEDESFKVERKSQVIETPKTKEVLKSNEVTTFNTLTEVNSKKEIETIDNKQPELQKDDLETIPSKPMLQIKELDNNPYSDRYKRTKSQNQKQSKNQGRDKKKQQKHTGSQNNVTSKKLISISQKNIEVLSILKNLDKKYDSESDFICRAIIEKYERDNEANNKEVDIKTLVKAALNELVEEKFIILKGSSDISINAGYVYPPQTQTNNPYIEQSSIDKAIEEKNQEENKDLLLEMLGALESDDDDF